MRFSYRFELTVVLTSMVWVAFGFGSFLSYRSFRYESISRHTAVKTNFINVLREASDRMEPRVHKQFVQIKNNELNNDNIYQEYLKDLKTLRWANQDIKAIYTAIIDNGDLNYILKDKEENILLEDFDNYLKKAFDGKEFIEYIESHEVILGYIPLFESEKNDLYGVLGGVLDFEPIGISEPAVPRSLVFIFLIFSIPFSLLLGSVVSGWITGPIKNITYVAKKIGNGNYSVKPNVNRADEVGTLAQVLDSVRKKLASFQKEMELKVAERTNSLKAMYREATAAREKNRIATELHDTLGQIFASLNVKLNLTLKLINQDKADKVVELLIEMQQITGKGTDLARKIISNLSGGLKEGQELKQVLDNFLNKFTAGAEIQYNLDVDISKTLPIKYRTAIYHIVTESTNNMGKHSKADKFEVSIRESEDRLKIKIQDNGRGFNMERILENLEKNRKFGLRSMQQKSQDLGGEFKIYSEEGEGCTVQIQLPLNYEQKKD